MNNSTMSRFSFLPGIQHKKEADLSAGFDLYG